MHHCVSVEQNKTFWGYFKCAIIYRALQNWEQRSQFRLWIVIIWAGGPPVIVYMKVFEDLCVLSLSVHPPLCYPCALGGWGVECQAECQRETESRQHPPRCPASQSGPTEGLHFLPLLHSYPEKRGTRAKTYEPILIFYFLLNCVTPRVSPLHGLLWQSDLTLTSDATVESSKMARIEWSMQDCVSISTSLWLRSNCRDTNITLHPCDVNMHAHWSGVLLPPATLQLIPSSGCDQKLRHRTWHARTFSA